ncbi:MAG: CinA family nicotinamide mononucleotide deamidase-related protein [Actinobacteria bacterium]|nr:MAG: CinA family nicotinamide mononucleotide deamidase-related protein [Actinomycetota bacterium]
MEVGLERQPAGPGSQLAGSDSRQEAAAQAGSAEGSADLDRHERRLLAQRARRLGGRGPEIHRHPHAGPPAPVRVPADLVRCEQAAEPRRAVERPSRGDSGRRQGQARAAARHADVDQEGTAGYLSPVRAVVVVTGSELVRGDRRDLNGPFLARELVSLGVEPAEIVIVGDAPQELEGALRTGLGTDLCVISGGLGPTHDDRTVETLARVAGRELVLDRALDQEIATISRRLADRLGRPYADFAAGVRKQATLPAGAVSLGLAGTAPGFVIQITSTVLVVLPGPPPELQRLWTAAIENELVREVLARGRAPERRTLRFYGVSESAVARALEEAGGDGAGVEATVCARDFEIHVDLVVGEAGIERADAIAAGLRGRVGEFLFSEDERTVAEIVLQLCRERGLTLATAESCTGGLVAARLTAVPGSSDVFRGAVVAYADDVKTRELAVPTDVLAAHEAVSAETAAAMAAGVRERLETDVGVSDTGVAGPGGGTAEKPVGLVYLHATGPDGELAAHFSVPADRETVRARAAVAALHLLRRLLSQSRDGSV